MLGVGTITGCHWKWSWHLNALTELARFLPRGEQPRNRYLRGGMRNREGEREGERRELRGPDAGLEPTRSALRTPWAPGNLPMALPPGASFDPEPPSGTI